MMRLGSILLLVVLLAPCSLVAETLEPPPESPEGEDYEAEPADSLAEDQLEIGLGATGRGGERPRHLRRVRFSGDSLGGTLREGDRDPLAGGAIEGRGGGGTFGIGRLSPRWGRGLLVGAPAEPWSLVPLDRGPRASFRGRAGQGVRIAGPRGLPCEALYGRFGDRALGGAALGWAGVTLASLAGAGGSQTSLGLDREVAGAEGVIDQHGRWRAEVAGTCRLGEASLGARLRGGHADFRSIAEPKRSGPAQAMSVGLEGRAVMVRYAAFGALWRFRPGQGGARAALELGTRPTPSTAVAVGFEEQHGLRREPTGAARGAGGFRQGWWSEWQAAAPALRLVVRHEGWGARRLARRPVRTVTAAGVETAVVGRATLRVTHTVFQVRRGESLYVPEPESDRLVLRALTGNGERTRLELALPTAGGTLRATAAFSQAEARRARAQWSVDWTRRGRWKRGS